MVDLADDAHMRSLEPLAEEFYEKVLCPDEQPGFVSDEASLLDISLTPEELLIDRIKAHYGKTVTRADLRKSFWSLLMDLNEGGTPPEIDVPLEPPQRKSSRQKISALTVGIIAALLTLSLYTVGSQVSGKTGQVLAGLLFPGLLGSMALAGNVHAFSLWVAAAFNGIFYCSLTWAVLSLLTAMSRRFR